MPIAPNPTIAIICRGLVLTSVKDGESFADIGAFKASPCHRAVITVKKVPSAGEEETVFHFEALDADLLFHLKVEKTTRSSIQRYMPGGFVRGHDDNDENDFRWFVDIDTDLHPDLRPQPDDTKVGPILRVNSALFYAESLTTGKMKIKRGAGQPEDFGRVAQTVGANIYFDQLHSKAVLMRGDEVLLTIDACDAVKGTTYVIEFDCECDDNSGRSDFDTIYTALKDLPAEKQVTFEGVLIPGIQAEVGTNPQVYCYGANTGQPISH